MVPVAGPSARCGRAVAHAPADATRIPRPRPVQPTGSGAGLFAPAPLPYRARASARAPYAIGLISTASSLVRVSLTVSPACSLAPPAIEDRSTSTGSPSNRSGTCLPFEALNDSVPLTDVFPDETAAITDPVITCAEPPQVNSNSGPVCPVGNRSRPTFRNSFPSMTPSVIAPSSPSSALLTSSPAPAPALEQLDALGPTQPVNLTETAVTFLVPLYLPPPLSAAQATFDLPTVSSLVAPPAVVKPLFTTPGTHS